MPGGLLSRGHSLLLPPRLETTVIPTSNYCHPDRAQRRGISLFDWRLGLGAHSPWPNPCDRSHGYNHFQRSRNSLTLRHALSFSENNHTHKRAPIDRKGLARGYQDYCSTAIYVCQFSCSEVLRSLTFVRDDSGVVRDDSDVVRDDSGLV